MEKEKVMDLLRKLLKAKLGEEELGNEAAAESFAAKIASLLIKHKLELSEIPEAEQAAADPLGYDVITPDEWNDIERAHRVLYIEDLAKVIAEAYFCKCLCILESNRVIFVGRATDREIARKVFSIVMRTGINTCEAELAISLIAGAGDGIRGYNESYRYSFFTGYNRKIDLRLYRTRLHEEAIAGNCSALIRAEQDVKDFIKDKLNPQDVPAPEMPEINLSAVSVGARHGERVNLNATELTE